MALRGSGIRVEARSRWWEIRRSFEPVRGLHKRRPKCAPFVHVDWLEFRRCDASEPGGRPVATPQRRRPEVLASMAGMGSVRSVKVTAEAARRFLVARQLVAPARSLEGGPNAVLEVFRRLGSIQFDPISVAGRSHDLVLHARVADYEPAWCDLLYERREIFEAYNKGLSFVPTSEFAWFRGTLRGHAPQILAENADVAARVLDRIRAEGPLSSLDFDPESGATTDWFGVPTNAVRAVLEAYAATGVLGLARRDGNRRYYDLLERLVRADVLERGELVPVEVEGLSGKRFVIREDVALLDAPPEPPPSVAFLSPFDPLVWDRKLLGSLFDFDYVWELFVPPNKRRWGWYVLPIVFRDRLVGRIEPRIDREEARVQVLNVWWENGFAPGRAEGFVDAMRDALRAYLRFAGATRLKWAPHLNKEKGLLRTHP